jgi:hypothetical protein
LANEPVIRKRDKKKPRPLRAAVPALILIPQKCMNFFKFR